MECADCGADMSNFMAKRFSLGRIDVERCFSCYLEGPPIAMEYDDVELRTADENATLIKKALSETLSVRLALLIETDPAEAIVIFTRTAKEADTLLTPFTESAFSPYLEEAHTTKLDTLFSDGSERLAWDAANWQHGGGAVRPDKPAYDVVCGVPCILDSHRFMTEETRESIATGLRDEFFQRVGKGEFDSLADVRRTVRAELPFVAEYSSFVTRKIVEYYRENPELIPTNFRSYDGSDLDDSKRDIVSKAEIERIYEEEVREADTYQDEILALLEAAEGASSSDIAEVVGCSVGHARRFTYDPSTGTAFRKGWSKAAESEKVSPAKRKRIIERDGECRRCGCIENLRVHHIVPIAFGGESECENLVVLCEECHEDAHAGSYYPPTTIYDGLGGFDDWVAE